jgi:hypothetical protein
MNIKSHTSAIESNPKTLLKQIMNEYCVYTLWDWKMNFHCFMLNFLACSSKYQPSKIMKSNPTQIALLIGKSRHYYKPWSLSVLALGNVKQSAIIGDGLFWIEKCEWQKVSYKSHCIIYSQSLSSERILYQTKRYQQSISIMFHAARVCFQLKMHTIVGSRLYTTGANQ